MTKKIDIAKLSAEERAALRAALDATDDDKDDNQKNREFWITNCSQADITIPDLTIGRGRNAEAYTLGRGKVVDLLRVFSAKELRRSHRLRMLLDDPTSGVLIGKHNVEERDLDPIAAQVRQYQGTDMKFNDPSFGKRDFDVKLVNAIKTGPAGEKEEEMTRRRM